MWNLTKKIEAILFLVNYSKKGTRYENEVLLMKVSDIKDRSTNPIMTEDKKYSRSQFSDWLRELNKEGNI